MSWQEDAEAKLSEAIESLKKMKENGKDFQIGTLQRYLRLGYCSAAHLTDIMVDKGFLSPLNEQKKRKILV